MNVLVCDASGATEREMVRQALGHGHSVGTFVRAPDTLEIKHANLAVMVGDVTECATVECAVRDAVASALGSGNSLGSDPALTDGVLGIVRAMDHAGVRRLVYLLIRGVGGRGMQLASRTDTSCCHMFAAIKRFAFTGEMLI